MSKLSKLNSLKNQAIALTLISVLSGCAFFKPKQILLSNYCDLHYPLATNSLEKDLTIISDDLFTYIKVNESTYACECLEPERKKQCQEEFLIAE